MQNVFLWIHSSRIYFTLLLWPELQKKKLQVYRCSISEKDGQRIWKAAILTLFNNLYVLLFCVCLMGNISLKLSKQTKDTAHIQPFTTFFKILQVFYVLRKILVGFHDPLCLWDIYFAQVHAHFDTHKHTQSIVNNVLITFFFPINHLATPWNQSPVEQSKNHSAFVSSSCGFSSCYWSIIWTMQLLIIKWMTSSVIKNLKNSGKSNKASSDVAGDSFIEWRYVTWILSRLQTCVKYITAYHIIDIWSSWNAPISDDLMS